MRARLPDPPFAVEEGCAMEGAGGLMLDTLPARLTRLTFATALVGLLALTLGCEEKKPARLSMDPGGPFKMYNKGQQIEVRVAPYDDKNRPYTKPIDVTWSSSDESVATVDDGKVKATGSGKATITATSGAIKAEGEAWVSIVGSLELAPGLPTELRLRGGKGKGAQMKVIVKDDKGNVMEKHPAIAYEVSNYCIDIYPDGTFNPVSEGECSAIAKCGGKEVRHKVVVK
jgi:hypothetical protein